MRSLKQAFGFEGSLLGVDAVRREQVLGIDLGEREILELLERIREETALLLITHDLGIIAGHCERLVVIEEGHLAEVFGTGVV